MELTQIRIGFPVLRIEARVFHATPRSPTAFERVLIRICDRFGNDATYNNIPLERIFADILGVAAPASVVVPTIRELTALDVIRCQSDVEALDTLILRDIEITDRGRVMLTEDMLPARAQENDEIFLYDPVRKCLLSSSEGKACRPHPSGSALDANAFQEVFPEQQIREQIVAGDYSWWNRASRIERVERGAVSVLWREAQTSLLVDGNALHFSLKDPDQTAYINSLTPNELYARFLQPIFSAGSLSEDTLALFPHFDIENIQTTDTKWLPLSSAFDDFPGRSRFWLVNQRVLIPVVQDVKPAAATHQAIITFQADSDSDDIHVVWNEAKNGCMISVKAEYPFEDALITSDAWMLRGRRVRVNIGRDTFELPLALQCSGGVSDPAVVELLAGLAGTLRNDEVDERNIVPAIWESEPDFWREHVSALISSSPTLNEALDMLHATRKRYVELVGSVQDTTWEKAVTDTVCGLLQALTSTISVETLKSVLLSLGRCRIASSGSIELLKCSLTPKISHPKELSDLAKLRAAFREAGQAWQIQYPSPFYTSDILSLCAKEFGSAAFAECFSDGNEFDKAVFRLWEIRKSLNTLIGGNGIQSLSDDNSHRNLLKQPHVSKISNEAEVWKNHFDAFVFSFPEIQPHLDGSLIAETNEQIEHILTLTRKLVGGLDPRFHAVFVIDTSALLECPAIMRAFRPDDFVVVSKRVIEELDDKKRDESLRPRVAEATRALQAFPKNQIQFCNGDMTLLPPDYRTKGDNLILSVALRYQKHRPVLLTNDNNLALKAKAEDITAMSVSEFESKPRRTQTPSKQMPSQSQKRNHPPRPRK